MALIGTIRKNSWILVVMVGLALAAFIIMDMSSSSTLGGGQQFTIGEVDGEQIFWNDFRTAESLLYSGSRDSYGAKSTLWKYFVEQKVIDAESKDLGLGVSSEELNDLQYGANLSPVMASRYTREQIANIKAQIDQGTIQPETATAWSFQESEVEKDRLQSKLNAMVSQAMYTPNWLAEEMFFEQNKKVDLAYVNIPFSSIPDESVTVSDADYNNYIKENAKALEIEDEKRVVDYLVFDILPTKSDTTEILASINDLISAFETAPDDSLFVVSNDGVYDEVYFSPDQLPASIKDTAFTIPVGSIHGPYIDNNAYNAVKVIDRKVIPDSVSARHILLGINAADQNSIFRAQTLMDSIQTALDGGADFGELAIKYSTDASNNFKGGDLGYFAQGLMVKPFNDLVFFKAVEGEINVVATQFGIHIVELTGRKEINNNVGVKIGIVSKEIIPSEETQNDVFSEAQDFLSKNRNAESLKTAVDADPTKLLETSNEFIQNDYFINTLGSDSETRAIIKWAFEPGREVGDVSGDVYEFQDKVRYYNNKCVLITLKSIQKSGSPKLADIKSDIEDAVLNMKKTEFVNTQLSGKTIQQLAGEYGISIDTASNIAFFTNPGQTLGTEGNVIATAFKTEVNAVSEAIEGSNGVYVVQPLRVDSPQSFSNLPFVRKQTSIKAKANVPIGLIEALKKRVKITDNRYTYY